MDFPKTRSGNSHAKIVCIMNIFVMSWRATLLGQEGHFWPAGHTLPTTALEGELTNRCIDLREASMGRLPALHL